MSELERIKELAECAAHGPWRMDPETYHVVDADGDGLAWDLRDEETAQFIAEARTLVPKLVALIEKIRDEAEERAKQYQATSDRLWGLVAARDPERSSQDATRYSAYAANAMASATIIDKTIKEGLTP